MKVTKGVIWALAGVLTLGAVLGGGPVWTAALAHAGEEPPSSAVPAVPGKAVPEQLALARLGGLGLTEEDAEALWADLGEDRRRELLRSLGAPEWLDYLAFGFSWWDRLDRYEAYHAQHPELTAEEAVVRVNIGLDAPPYGDPEEVEDPDSLTALVNQYHALPADYAPKVVYLTAAYTNQRDRLRPVACRAFMKMADAAAQEGLRIYNASAYRSYTTQCSEHQTGLALDINTASLSDHFEETEEYAWLVENSWRYGFILRFPEGKEEITGYQFEPWHYRYVGPAAARVCYENGWTLEEYHARQPAPDR